MHWIPVAAACVAMGAVSAAAVEITVDASQRHQTIDGFGTCLISWTPRMAEYYRRPEVVRAYADDMRFNILRCNLWGDGTIGPVEDPARISHRDPAFARDDRRSPVFIQFARDIRRINPDVKVIGTVWSPPAWMKENGRITDTQSNAALGADYKTKDGQELKNRVKKEYYPHFVKWMVEMAKHYEANGVPIYALSPANEPDFTQTFESCVWSTPDLVTITAMLGEALEKEGLGHIKIFGPESMTGFNWNEGPNQRFVRAVQADPTAWEHFDIWATHGYSNGVNGDMSKNSSAEFWGLIKDTGKPYWVTEGGTGGHSIEEAVGDRGVGAGLHNAFVAGNASAFVPWQFAENSRSEHNIMHLDGPTKKTHVVRHYSRFIPAGSTRIEATPAYGDVTASAYALGADGERAGLTIVLTNPGEQEQPVTLKLQSGPQVTRLNVVRTSAREDFKSLDPAPVKDGVVTLTLPGQSIVTLTTETLGRSR